MPTLSSEQEPQAQPAIDETPDVTIFQDVVPETKAKPRKARSKPQPVIVTVPLRKKAVRFPDLWTRELRACKLPSASEPKVRFKSTVKLPLRWAAVLRANPAKPVINARLLPESLPECDVNTKRIIEALLFAANRPLTIKQIQEAFPELEQPDTLEIQLALEAIAQDYLTRPIGLKQLASGYRFQVKEGMAPWVTRLFEEKPARYSRALLETLSIIAYRQPVTRGEIEDIRGVGVSSGIIHTLLEREWIRVIAHKEVPGRPALYGTTKQFLDYFNLTSLNELPTLAEISDLDFSNELPLQEPRERPQTEPSQAENDHPATEPETGSEPQATDTAVSAAGRTLH